MHGRMTLLDGDGGFRLVGSSAFFNPDKSFSQLWWRMSLDPAGRRVGLNEFPAKPNEADVHAAVALPGDRTLAIGGRSQWIVQVDAHGTLQPPKQIRPGDFDIHIGAAVADQPGSLLVAGSRTISYERGGPQKMDAWLARIRHDGSVVWQNTFDRAHMDMAAAMLPLRDRGCVLAVNSGKYNKFGAGPTALWLLRCDADGNKLAEAVVDGAQIYARGQKYLAALGDSDDAGLVVSYTVGQVGTMDFHAHAAAFDKDLKPIWRREIAREAGVETMPIARTFDGQLALAGEIKFAPAVSWIDPRDGQVTRRAALPLDGHFSASDVVARNDGVIAVGAFKDRDVPRERALQQDVLIFKVR